MKKIILLLFILTTIMTARAQQRGYATLDGVVYMSDSVNVIEGAIVKVTNGDSVYIDTTGTDGYYTFDSIKAYEGLVNYTLTTEVPGFFNDTIIVTVSNGDQITQNVYLAKAGSIEGNVTLNDESGVYGNVSDALLCLIFNNETIQTINPDPITGYYIFDKLQEGEYRVNVSLDNFMTQDSIIEIDSTETDTCNFSLNLIPGSIKGQVLMEEMQLVNSVKVTLNDEYEVHPDSLTGLYEFDNIIPGIYTIKASFENYCSNPVNYPDENLLPGDSIINKHFTMQEPTTIMDNPADISVCAGEEVYFEVSLNIDKGVTYKWQVNGSDIEDDAIYSGANSDKLRVKTNYSLNQKVFQCKITTQCKDILSDSAVLTVHRLPIDTLIIKGSPPVLLISPDSGQIYQWYKNGVSLPGENGQYYYPTGGFDGGSEYYLVINTEFSCTDTTNSYIAPANKSISVYLNPVSNTLFIDATSLPSKSELTVFISDISGRQLIRKSICHDNRKMNLSVNRLIQGVYLITIVDDTGLNIYSSKIIKR